MSIFQEKLKALREKNQETISAEKMDVLSGVTHIIEKVKNLETEVLDMVDAKIQEIDSKVEDIQNDPQRI